jgi:hypothetical protein
VTIVEYFSEAEDPREDNKRYLLLDIIGMTICAAICGADIRLHCHHRYAEIAEGNRS